MFNAELANGQLNPDVAQWPSVEQSKLLVGGFGNVFKLLRTGVQLAIGVDSNQDWIKPGYILTSMMKRVDEAVFDSIRMFKEGKFETGLVRYGVKSKGVDYSVDEHNAKLVAESDKKQLEALRAQIISGQIKVPDYYLVQKKK